jgi:hypothetical protein
MKIEPIIYQTTRGLYSLEDKLSIASLIIFSYKLGSKKFSELLYTNNHKNYIDNLQFEYKEYEIDFSIKLYDKQIKDCFIKTIEKVKEKYDSDGYLKALFEKDEFAIVIEGIVNYNFDKVEFKSIAKNIKSQLSLIFEP